ncbi:MFS general substrate transporter [Gautieria morchelliformis]|nr:MFS general substrate transporter [Gautieria morchelliformis]
MAPYFLRNFIPKKDPAADRQRPLYRALLDITWIQWSMVFSGWLAWTCDAMDFFSVSLAIPILSKPPPVGFGRPTATLTNAITLTLLFRPVGAILFGFASDRFGRKWPLIWNLLLCCVLQIGSSFCNTYQQFLAARSLFGIAMGGIWGLAIATALENVPVDARGFLSGVLQEGYAVGYLLAAVVNLTVVAHNVHSWRTLFWVAAGITFFAACVRVFLPESEVFLRAREDRRAQQTQGASPASKTRVFLRETKSMLKAHWKLCIYAVLLMTGFNFLSHGSQDLYPTYLQDNKRLSSNLATKATIIGNCGAVVGGALAGAMSQLFGRRLTIVIFCCIVGAFIPLWILPSGFGALAAGAFCIQIGVQGAWGVIPIFLNELSPPAFRATFPGVAYQVGNMVSSSSARIEAVGGENLRTTVGGKDVPDYAKVQGILIGVVAAFIVIVVILGPENHGSHFEKHRVAFEEGGGQDDAYVEDEPGSPSPAGSVRDVHEKEAPSTV